MLRHKSVLVCVDEPTNEEKNETVRESAIFVKLEMVYTDGKYGFWGLSGFKYTQTDMNLVLAH